MNVEIGAEAAQFPEKEYINGIAIAVYYRVIHNYCTFAYKDSFIKLVSYLLFWLG
jgi:hypothetical protein